MGIITPHNSDLIPDQDQDHHHHDENIAINIIPRFTPNLKPIKIKVDHDDDQIDQDHDNCDGLKTPTGDDHKIPVNPPCPPAPKRKRMPAFKRRRSLFDSTTSPQRVELSSEEIKLMFPRRGSSSSTSNIIHHLPKVIRKVNKTTLMSFRQGRS